LSLRDGGFATGSAAEMGLKLAPDSSKKAAPHPSAFSCGIGHTSLRFKPYWLLVRGNWAVPRSLKEGGEKHFLQNVFGFGPFAEDLESQRKNLPEITMKEQRKAFFATVADGLQQHIVREPVGAEKRNGVPADSPCLPRTAQEPIRHSRHSFSTMPIANGEDVKVVQELMRHANCTFIFRIGTTLARMRCPPAYRG
jgi:hypothetical protein